MITPEAKSAAEALGSLAGIALASFAIYCLRAYLLGICCSMFFPSLVLSFWQWLLIAFTFRALIGPLGIQNDK
jgi:hypothetical protein